MIINLSRDLILILKSNIYQLFLVETLANLEHLISIFIVATFEFEKCNLCA